MLAQQRHSAIIAEVQAKGSAQVQELAELLDVSPMTIRRDLAELDAQGLLSRVHGGATVSDSAYEPVFAEKTMLNAEEKVAIARAAAHLVNSGQTIAIAGGSTCVRLAQEVATRAELTNLTIITNSLPVSDVFHGAKDARVKVLLIGGERTPSDAFVGPLAEASLENLSADLLFFGAHGVDERGFHTPNLSEASTNRALMSGAREVAALFDASKWGVAGLSRFASWSEVNTVVTDALTSEQQNVLNERATKVVIA